MQLRVNLLGASGTGASTLARGLASALGTQAFDADDFLWLPSDPPFRTRRPRAERMRLVEELFLARPDWLLAGNVIGWGDGLSERLTHVIFLHAPPERRLARLRRRERQRHGARIAPGGDMNRTHRAFLDWAMRYDDPGFPGPSRAQHEAWLAGLSFPVIRLDASGAPAQTLAAARAALDPAQVPG